MDPGGKLYMHGTTVFDNYAKGAGGGIAFGGAMGWLSHVSVVKNRTDGNGGGIHVEGATGALHIQKSSIGGEIDEEGNEAGGQGGGINCQGGEQKLLAIETTLIGSNRSSGTNTNLGGGGIASKCELQMYESGVLFNSSQGGGGGIAVDAGTPDVFENDKKYATGTWLRRVDIRGNNAKGLPAAKDDQRGRGGGVFARGAVTIQESSIENNRGSQGVGVNVASDSNHPVTIANTTILDNEANLPAAVPPEGLGVRAFNVSIVDIVNSTVGYNADPAETKDASEVYADANGQTLVKLRNSAVAAFPGGPVNCAGKDASFQSITSMQQVVPPTPTATCPNTPGGALELGLANPQHIFSVPGTTLELFYLLPSVKSPLKGAGTGSICAGDPVGGVDELGAPRVSCDIGAKNVP